MSRRHRAECSLYSSNLSECRERADGVAAVAEAADLHGHGARQADEPFLRRRRTPRATGGRDPEAELVLTIAPPPWRAMCGIAAAHYGV